MTVVTNQDIRRLRALAECGVTRHAAARAIGVSNWTLDYWMEREHILFPSTRRAVPDPRYYVAAQRLYELMELLQRREPTNVAYFTPHLRRHS